MIEAFLSKSNTGAGNEAGPFGAGYPLGDRLLAQRGKAVGGMKASMVAADRFVSVNQGVSVGGGDGACAMSIYSSTFIFRTAQHLKEQGWTQAEAARHLGITQPRVSRLMKGKVEDFSLDMLLTLAARVGLHPELRLSV